MKTPPVLLAAALLWVTLNSLQGAPSVGVFDPETNGQPRLHMDVAEMNAAARTLENAGLAPARVNARQLADAAALAGGHFDVLVLRGDTIPRDAFASMQQFARDGGVVVALAAKDPFHNAVARKPNGQWVYSPESPQFSWQTNDVAEAFGVRTIYRPALIDSGVRHTATALFKKYLPQAADHAGVLPSSWVTPSSGGAFYPLIRSQRADGRDVSPQLYIARKGNAFAVISSGDRWTRDNPDWPAGEQTVVAMVRIALDLKSGALKLSDADKIDLPVDLPAAEPLTSRRPTGEVNPDGAPVLTRWGKFDGSGLEFDDKSPLPRVLRPGATIELPLASSAAPVWLRVRGAIAESGAVLKVAVGSDVFWNESLAYLDVGRVGNFGETDLSGVPCEFNRRVFLPPTGGKVLTLSNPGDKPLYFDAVQLENAPAKPVVWMTGMVASWNQLNLRQPVNLPHGLTSEWSGIRGTLWAQDVKAPGDPDRWSILDRRVDGYLATGAPLEMLIEDTPAWAAISADRYRAADRKRTVPPDPEKYREIVQHVLTKYADKVDLYEIWNEVDSQGYWLGTADEYVRLWKTIVPMIRQADPTARVMLSGMTGFSVPFLETVVAAGLPAEADMIGFHPYAGNQAAWDKPYTTFQGQLYSLGQNIEIYNNEMGFPNTHVDWFTSSPFPYTPTTQARMTDVALSRLLANGVAKICIFDAGGADGGLGYIRGSGEPYPAYRVLADYFPLSKKKGERWDISMARVDGAPQRGVYLAGSRHDDGSITVVLNPAEVVAPDFAAPAEAAAPEFKLPLRLRVPLPRAGKWKATFGGKVVPIDVNQNSGSPWGEVTVELTARTVLEVSPAD